MYYFFTQNLDDESMAEISGHTKTSGQYLWTLGEKFKNSMALQVLELDTDDGCNMPDFFDSSISVVSSKLLKSLIEIGVDNFDTYPVILKNKKLNKEFLDYVAINFIGCVDAIDQGNSEFEFDSFGDPEYSFFVINSSMAKDHKVFRLINGPDLLVVHKDIVDKLENYKFKALLLQKTEDFDGF